MKKEETDEEEEGHEEEQQKEEEKGGRSERRKEKSVVEQTRNKLTSAEHLAHNGHNSTTYRAHCSITICRPTLPGGLAVITVR